MIWSSENVKTLRTLIASGASSTEVAKAVGCSRSAALNKARSLGVKFQTDHARRSRVKGRYLSETVFRRHAEKIAKLYSVGVAELIGPCVQRYVAHPRQHLMYELRISGFSFPEIARVLDRDNATVQYGVREFEKRLSTEVSAVCGYSQQCSDAVVLRLPERVHDQRMEQPQAHQVVADALFEKSPEERTAYAMQLLAYASAALVIQVGAEAAAVEMYRIADHMATCAA